MGEEREWKTRENKITERREDTYSQSPALNPVAPPTVVTVVVALTGTGALITLPVEFRMASFMVIYEPTMNISGRFIRRRLDACMPRTSTSKNSKIERTPSGVGVYDRHRRVMGAGALSIRRLCFFEAQKERSTRKIGM